MAEIEIAQQNHGEDRDSAQDVDGYNSFAWYSCHITFQ